MTRRSVMRRVLDWLETPLDSGLRAAKVHARDVGFTVYPECQRCGIETPYPCLYCGMGEAEGER